MVRKYTSRLIPIIAVAVIFGACDGGKESQELQSIDIVSDPHGDCANGTTVSLGKRFRVGTVDADIDGDGTEDSVWVAIDPKAPVDCQSFLAAETESELFWVALNPHGEPRSLQNPSINTVASINDVPGDEVVVNLESGASTQFVGLYTLSRPGLELVFVDGRGPGPFSSDLGSLIPFGGSVGHLDGVDCAGEGVVVMTAAVPSGDTADSYRVERRYFNATRNILDLEKERTEHETVTARDLDELTELTSAPFGSCE